MYVERIRFDRVFDAAPGRGDFSFTSGERTTHGAILPGRHIPQDGATLVLVTTRPGDWSTLLGYRDIDSGRVWQRQRSRWIALAQLETMIWLGPFSFAVGLAIGGTTLALVLLGGVTLAVATAFQHKYRRVRALLHAA